MGVVKNTHSTWFLICHLCNIFDALFTIYAVSKGVDEANPIMAWAIEVSPLFFITTKLIVFTIAINFLSKNKPAIIKWVASLFILVMLWHLSFLFIL